VHVRFEIQNGNFGRDAVANGKKGGMTGRTT